MVFSAYNAIWSQDIDHLDFIYARLKWHGLQLSHRVQNETLADVLAEISLTENKCAVSLILMLLSC